MRLLGWFMVVQIAVVADARADKRITDLIPGLEREHTACTGQVNGMTRIANGAAELAKSATGPDREELEKDAAALAKGLASFKEYCDDVGTMVAYLKDNANAAYKAVEREIDTRDNKVRALRAAGKKLVEELAPTTRKLIPKIAQRPKPVIEEKRTAVKFPSGRTVELPSLPGTWRLSGSSILDSAEYNDKATSATVTARTFNAASCDQQKKALAGRSDVDQIVDVDVAKDTGVTWSVRYTKRDKPPRLVQVMCAPTKTGGVLATADLVPADQTALADDLARVMLRMIATQLDPKAPKP
jgi:hypothetical protein